MSTRHHKHEKRAISKAKKSLAVTSKCLAIVLTPDESDDIPQNGEKVAIKKLELTGKDILEDFKLRNKTCYWNPALVESIGNLQYIGYVEPCTILVGAADIHLENLRTAWGRRVLNDPASFKIQKIGDVEGIEMQVIPQTQFIPLPEILCLIILELNNKQIIATLDVIHERLKQYFQDMRPPSSQLLYEALGSLIRERKCFHTGSGYFVVTPDTYRLPTDQHQLSYPLSWMHYNQMYIPVLNQHRAECRDISCQVSLVSQPQKLPRPPKEEEEPIYKGLEPEVEKLPPPEKPRVSRSLSARRVRDKSSKEEVDTKAFQRSSSVRSRGGKATPPVCRDVNLANSNINKVKDKGEKKSLLSKIFGRSKKKKQEKQADQKSPAPESNEAEYATFSGQFPPPEWKWYQEQVEKQHRLHNWVSCQRENPHPVRQHPTCPIPQGLCNRPPLSSVQSEEHYCQIDPRFEMSMRNFRASTLPVSQPFDHHCKVQGHTKVKDSKAFTLPAQPEENHYTHRRHSESHRHGRDSTDRPRVRRHSGERRTNNVPTLHEDIEYQNTGPAMPYHVHPHHRHFPEPIYSSTPRVTCHQDYEHVDTIHNNTIDELHNTDKQVVHRRSGNKKSSKNRHHRHSYGHGHIGNDITYEYNGKMAKKNLQRALSRDSGVNCIGLDKEHPNAPLEKTSKSKSSNKKQKESQDFRKDKSNNLVRECSRNDMKLDYKKNEVICVAEINNCVPHDSGETTPDMETPGRALSDSTHDSVVEESEKSYDTVIDSKKVTDVSDKVKNMHLGDSGFSSPRICENQNDFLSKEEKENECPSYCQNSLTEYNSSSNDSPEEQGSQDVVLTANKNDLTVLNNTKQVSKEHGVLSHHINVMQTDLSYPQQTQSKLLHMNFEGDYQVVGVV